MRKFYQCEATVDRKGFPQCSCSARVEIDGINLCLKHAGTLAVVKLLNNKQAKVLNTWYKNDICSIK